MQLNMEILTICLFTTFGFVVGAVSMYLALSNKSQITRRDIISDDAMRAPLEMAKNMEKVLKQLEILKKEKLI